MAGCTSVAPSVQARADPSVWLKADIVGYRPAARDAVYTVPPDDEHLRRTENT